MNKMHEYFPRFYILGTLMKIKTGSTYHFLLSTYSLEVSFLQSQKRICRREWNKAKSTCTCPNTCSNTFPNTWYDRNHYFSLGFDTQIKNGQYFWADTVTSGNQISKEEIYLSIWIVRVFFHHKRAPKTEFTAKH